LGQLWQGRGIENIPQSYHSAQGFVPCKSYNSKRRKKVERVAYAKEFLYEIKEQFHFFKVK